MNVLEYDTSCSHEGDKLQEMLNLGVSTEMSTLGYWVVKEPAFFMLVSSH